MLLPPKLQVALNITSIFFAAFFITPTMAIVASWNALPGDQLYPTKRTLERIALAITAPNYNTQSTLQTKLIARRTSEAADDVLKKSSSKGLDELRLQATALRKQIAQAPTPQAKRVAANQAVRELRRTQQKLARTRQALAQATPPTRATPSQNTPPAAKPAGDIEDTAELADDIEDTEDDIDDTIEDIENDPDVGEVPQEPTPTPTPTPASNQLFQPQGDTNTNTNTNDTNTNNTENNNGDHPASSPPGRRNPQGDGNTPDQAPQGPSTPQDASSSSL